MPAFLLVYSPYKRLPIIRHLYFIKEHIYILQGNISIEFPLSLKYFIQIICIQVQTFGIEIEEQNLLLRNNPFANKLIYRQ